MPNIEDLVTAEQAWDKATAGITGAAPELLALRDRFVLAIVAGAPLADVEQALEDQLSELDWQWPWFEEWYQTFSGWGAYPFLWPPLAPEPDAAQPFTAEELANYRKAAIAPLIAHTAAMIFYRDRHLSKAHMHQAWRLAHLNDPAEMRVATAKELAIMSGDMSSLPPFFPGDRTALQAQNPIGPGKDKRPPETLQ